ncbi:MAG: hypothetical protein COA94_08050 [Rickettsiales bacterium]|nr:MAG: hypothetical protein COA94_08050 [Rickettsiales bacterium]
MVRIISFLSLILFSSFSFSAEINRTDYYENIDITFSSGNTSLDQFNFNDPMIACSVALEYTHPQNEYSGASSINWALVIHREYDDQPDSWDLGCNYYNTRRGYSSSMYVRSNEFPGQDGKFTSSFDSSNYIIFESAGSVSTEPEIPETDTDGDGIPNIEDLDIDGDGIPNEQDDDVDGDGVPNYIDNTPYGEYTEVPGYDDMDGDGIPDSTDNDIDGDGIPNYIDSDPLSDINKDTDGDGIPDNQDLDIDDDGFINEEDDDIDGDGILNGEDNDIDGDGTLNNQDSDIDGDGIPNYQDDDIDSDGIPNYIDNSPNGWNVNSPEDGPTYCLIGGFYMGRGDCSNYATDENGDGEYTTDEVNDPDSLIPDQVPIDSQPDSPAILETGYWTPIYPDGFSGVLLDFKKEIEKSKFMEFLDSFRFTNDGTVPVFTFNFDIGIHDFGIMSIDPDQFLPGVFGFLKVIVLISATLFAFRIVF